MLIMRILLILFLSIGIISCSGNSTEPAADNLSVSFVVDRNLQKQNLENIELNSVKILIHSLKLNSSQGDSSNVKTDPFVVELNLNGDVNTVAVVNVPGKSYDKIKFEIHKLKASASPPDPDFTDGSNVYSVIVQGVYEGSEFIYKSKKSAKQNIKLDDPITTEENGVLNVTLVVNPYDWFNKNGVILDPTKDENENDIDNLIKDSFKKGFRDNNKDGLPD